MGSEIKDPGIGTKVDKNTRRIINADGTYNVNRKGSRSIFRDVFRYLVEISWTKFFLLLFGAYILLNFFFTFLYLICGFENIAGLNSEGNLFIQAFFFSIQTFTTVGYGVMSPTGIETQSVAAVEAFIGFLSFSLMTGLLWGRFSRPQSKLLFADNLVYSKFEDGYSFKFKFTNERDVVLQDVEAKIITMFNKTNENGEVSRAYFQLPLTLPRIEIMALSWTLVHKIDKDSPFWGKSKAEIQALHPEFLILINAFDEVYSDRTRGRKSYIVDDIIWHKNFKTIFHTRKDGVVEMDVRDIHEVEDE